MTTNNAPPGSYESKWGASCTDGRNLCINGAQQRHMNYDVGNMWTNCYEYCAAPGSTILDVILAREGALWTDPDMVFGSNSELSRATWISKNACKESSGDYTGSAFSDDRVIYGHDPAFPPNHLVSDYPGGCP